MNKPRVLFIAPLPPPVHGSAMVSQYIKDSRLVNEQYDCDFVNLSTSRRMDEIGKGGIKKILRFIGAYLSLLWKLLTRRYDLCYLAITCHGVGFLKDAPFVLLCKLFRRRVLIHQHNKGMSRYVERWPYRWLLPLVYRNTRVMLLSWHLYPDIERVVKREQVVVCANGIPEVTMNDYRLPITDEQKVAGSMEKQRLTINDERLTLNEDSHPEGNSKHYTLNAKQEFSHTEYTESTENASLAENASQQDLNTMTQNLQVASPLLASGAHTHPDGVSAMSAAPSLRGQTRRVSVATTAGLSAPRSLACELSGGKAPYLLFLSNLIPSKGVYVLLDACRVLKERGLQFVCDFVGGETKEIDRATFEAAVKERDLEGIVCYHGPKYGEEKEEYWRRADVFVQPTFDDCFPLTLVEAMQHRLPIVSTDVGAIPDMIKEEVNGFICPQRDVDSLVTALEKLITDPVLRQQMGEQGYQRYQEEFTLEAFERRFVAELKGDD